MPTNYDFMNTQEKGVYATSRSVIFTLAGVLILTVFVNFSAKYYLDNSTRNLGYFLIKKKWEILKNLDKPVDLIILGDSSCNQGVNTDLITEQTGLSALNLCTIGKLLALNDSWMLDYYIRKHGTPDKILITHVYDFWYREINKNVIAKIPLSWGFWEDLKPNLNFSLSDKLKMFVAKYFPLYSENVTAKKMMLQTGDKFFSKEVSFSNSGYMWTGKAYPNNVNLDMKYHIEFTGKNEFFVSLPNQIAMQEIIDTAEKNDIELYISTGPLYAEIYLNSEFRNYYDKVQTYLENLAANRDNVHLILGDTELFDSDELQNIDHLIFSSANKFTMRIIDEMFNPENQGVGEHTP